MLTLSTSISKQNIKMWFQSGTSPWNPKNIYPWSCWLFGNFILVSSEPFKNKLKVCEIAAELLLSEEHEVLSKSKMTVIPHPPSLLTRFSAMWLLSFPKTHDGIKGKKIYWYHHCWSETAGCTCQVSNNAIHKMLQMVMYKVHRRWLWRGQHWLEGRCCYGEIS